MPIIEIKEDHVRQRCAKCGNEKNVQAGDLTSGAEAGMPETGVLGLPPCACGATEFLIRAPEGEPEHPCPGSFGHLHRMAVDALVDGLRERAKGGHDGKSLAGLVEAQLGPSVVAQWFPDGLHTERRDSVREGQPPEAPEEQP